MGRILHRYTRLLSSLIISSILMIGPAASTVLAIEISETMPNPMTISDADGEWVEIHNPDASDVDISGWQLDDGSNTFTFPLSSTAMAGEYIVVCADILLADANCDFEWTTMSLANAGDTISLRDNTSSLVDTLTYTASDVNDGQSIESITDGSGNDVLFSNSTDTYTTDNTGTPGSPNTSVLPVKNTNTGEEFNTIQKAIDDADTTDGHTITVAAGTYVEAINITKSLTINGAGQGSTIIDASTLGGYSMEVLRNNTTISDFKLMGNPTGTYGIKISSSDSSQLLNITVKNVTVSQSYRTAIDLNGVVGATLENVTAQDTPRGNGISTTDSSNISIINPTTRNNAWGGIALYTYGRYYPLGSDNIVVTGHDYNETNPLYYEIGNYSNPAAPADLTNVNHPQYQCWVKNDVDLPNFTWWQQDLAAANNFADNYIRPAASNPANVTVGCIDNERPAAEFIVPAADGQVFSGMLNVQFSATDNQLLDIMTVNIKDSANAAHLGACGTTSGINAASYVFDCDIDTASFADGDYYLRASARDVAGNIKTISRPLTFDNTKPSVQITSHTNSQNVMPDFTVEGLASDSTSSVTEVKYTVNQITGIGGSHVANGPSGVANLSGGTFDFDVNGLSEGYYRIKVQAFDAAGNWKYHYVDVLVDDTRPTVGFISPTTGQVVSGIWGVQLEASDVNGISRVAVNLYDGSGFLAACGSNSTVGGLLTLVFDCDLDTGSFSDGDYYLKGGAFDLAGNNKTISQDFVIDNTPPTVDITSPLESAYVSDVIEVKGSVNDANPYRYYAVVRDSDGNVVAGPGTVYDSNSFTDQVLFSWDTNLLADGDYVIWLAARDAAGNRDDTVSLDTINVTVDNTHPDAFNVSPADGAYANGASLTQEWGSTATDVARFEYQSYNDAGGSSLRWQSSYTGNSKTAINVSETEFWWRVRAIDMAGNASDWTDLWKITVDNTAPDAFNVSPADGTVTNGASLTQIWGSSFSDILNFNYRSFNDAAGTSLRWSETITSTSKTAINVSESEFWWQVQAVDYAGNTSAWTGLWQIIIDNTPPVVAFSAQTTTDTSPALVGTVSSDATLVRITVDGQVFELTPVAGVWQLPGGSLTDLSPGAYDVSLYAEDAAGNSQTTEYPLSLVINETSTTEETTDTNQQTDNPQTTIVAGANDQNDQGENNNDTNNQGGSQDQEEPTADQETTEVLGSDTENEDSSSTDQDDNQDKVEGQQDNGDGYNWWWWLLLLSVPFFWWFIIGRRRRDDEDT